MTYQPDFIYHLYFRNRELRKDQTCRERSIMEEYKKAHHPDKQPYNIIFENNNKKEGRTKKELVMKVIGGEAKGCLMGTSGDKSGDKFDARRLSERTIPTGNLGMRGERNEDILSN